MAASFILIFLLPAWVLSQTTAIEQLNVAATPAGIACTQLQSQLGTTIIQTAPSPEYTNVSTSAWNRNNALSHPACIALPRAASDVQAVMRSIYKNQVKYAVQAGGHSANAGWSSVDASGILISFTHMKSISYNPTTDHVTLDPGIRWGEVLEQLEPFGVAALGGRLGDIGTGLLLGGGLSFLSPGHGFSVDSLIEADVVLVNGDLVTATATNKYSDLFKALKGGVDRFGIVTRYVVQAVHVGRKTDLSFYGGTLVFDNSSSEALLKATADFINNVNDPNASLLSVFSVSFANNTLIPANLITFLYNGASPPSGIYDSFLKLPALGSSVGLYSYIGAVQTLLGTGKEGGGQGQIFGASAFANAEWDRTHGQSADPYAKYLDAFGNFLQYTESVRGRPSNTTSSSPPTKPENDPTKDGVDYSLIAFTSVQKSQIQIGRARGGNIIDAPLTNYALVQFSTQMPAGWDFVPGRVRDARREFLQSIPPSPGIPLYINECASEQNIFSTYGGFESLKKTYKKYDPTQFNIRFTEGPIGL